MKQFMSIYKFELTSYLKNKIFVGVTIALLVVIMGVLSIPRMKDFLGNETEEISVRNDARTGIIDRRSKPDYECSSGG